MDAVRHAPRLLTPATHDDKATMDVDIELTGGVLDKLMSAEPGDEELWTSGPTMQIINVKKVSSPQSTGPDRYRVIISDGTKFAQSMLATQLSHMVEKNELKKFTIVKVKRLTLNLVQSKRCVLRAYLLRVSIISFRLKASHST